MRRFWAIGSLWMLVTFLGQIASAQSPGRVGVDEALDVTDRRIELAVSLLERNPSAPAQAHAELALARDLQARARSAFAANQPVISLRETMDARSHADRVVSLLRGLPDPDRVRGQVERTRDIIDRARDRLQTCEVARARGLMKVALEMQQRAENRLTSSMYLGALQLTMSARERVLKAMQLCNVGESLADATDRALQRTNDVLARAQETIDSDAPPAVHEALTRAQSLQAQAQDEARLDHFESALRLTQGARSLAQRALRPGRALRARGH